MSWRTAVNTASNRDEAPTTPALPIRASVGFTPTPVSIRILPRGEPLAYPTKPLHRQEVRAEQDPCNFNTDYINAVKTDEARRRGRTWLAQSHVLSGTCTDEDTGFAAAHITHTHTNIIMHGEREAKTTKTTTRLNRRYLAEQPAGVINRELFEAPGTRRPHIAIVRQAALVGHGAQPFFMGSCNFVHPKR